MELEIGKIGKTEIMVAEEHSAAVMGSGLLEVFSTPCMVALMENASLKAVELAIPEGRTTVGISMNIKHLAATPIGRRVWATGKLIEVKGNKLVFEVQAYDEKDKIGDGIHERYIVDEYAFVEKCTNKFLL